MADCADLPPVVPAAPIRTAGMPLDLNWIAWMPSPPLAPDHGPIDLAHLERMTLGDDGLAREVLAMFAAQAAEVMQTLAKLPPDAAALAHRLKGSARAIGAMDVADAADRIEAALRRDADAALELTDLSEAVAAARVAIDAILMRS